MIIAQIFAAWLVMSHGDTSLAIPFNSFTECEAARKEYLAVGGYSNSAAVCIHGKM